MQKKLSFITLLLSCFAVTTVNAQSAWKAQPVAIATRWTPLVSPENALPEYPRPQMVRSQWVNLNGLWDYAITKKDAPAPQQFQGKILVPYPLESALSGVKKSLLPDDRLWYRRNIDKPSDAAGKRVLLHFGAVDWQAVVYVNGKQVGDHAGGYQAFTLDITDALHNGSNQLLVSVWDPSDQGNNPRGKQVLQPRGIMYTASSGIWQTVWLETVPDTYISNISIIPQENTLKVVVSPNDKRNCKAEVTVYANGAPVANISGKTNDTLEMPIPDVHHWSPEDPFLYDLSIKIYNQDKPVDSIRSYAGMRTISIMKDAKGQERIYLNGKYTYNLGVLDQGFWPDGLYTAPTDEALRFDILAVKSMGFNTIRKHIKLEPARWYYHCDKLGILVWQDMVTCANESPTAKIEFEKENAANIELLKNHPSIVCWVLFNEGWARYDQQRLTEWMKKTDPSRLINGHTGENYDRRAPANPLERWKSADLTDVHDYPGPGIAPALTGKARVLGEWGGVQVRVRSHQWNAEEGWGYISVAPAEFSQKYEYMIKHLKIYEEEGLSGSIYTEPYDVEIEENGLMTYDREVIKIPLEKIREIHRMIIPATGPVPTDFKIKDMDTTNPDNRYTDMLRRFKSGYRDSSFLKELAQMAVRLNDMPNAQKAADDYLAQIKAPFSRSQWLFIFNMATSVKSTAFKIIAANKEAADKVMGTRQADMKLMTVIYADVINPNISGTNEHPNWFAMQQKAMSYGVTGEEVYLRSKTLYHLNNKQWKQFFPAATRYVAKFAKNLSLDELNRYATTVFYRSDDSSMLLTASGWSRICLEQGERSLFMNTQANLLYKAGRKQEAIAIQERALALAPDQDKKPYESTLEKMKRNEPTW
ncbi:glycosyl hydrolase family 2 [Chitinophaga dinghuensis]|uniref:Glycosyl hydrolase family 2 n=1 Tax=Chitinophaga dinghuensis TaxID=1539050 RepID=A0A327VYA4_9BACT|nr:sugar-binding domain-containing protein [Chitinophaga dinghuensis]RAJ80180.1 glycosyl hydrolase family 2 [Chitinophaga dinghuensis]